MPCHQTTLPLHFSVFLPGVFWSRACAYTYRFSLAPSFRPLKVYDILSDRLRAVSKICSQPATISGTQQLTDLPLSFLGLYHVGQPPYIFSRA
ncbi:hypothetical protein VFPPC_16195 [Pochonia chlamydosporia 170]|uniref:Secreted protein n=1 Tax=Pochonia chlamydosporia 170 TaxID=1380566 RepID=A0A179FFI3_METCM|nr:hypothetical protein VFPPC_16195 [Pochonia chlamydosporia 170]OAQ64282.1 hypothetical protein VFPPC_16195 [Pochonia chlamydosporia 170]